MSLTHLLLNPIPVMVDLLDCSTLALLLLASNLFELLWVFILVLDSSTILVDWWQNTVIKVNLINLCLSSTWTVFLLVLFKVIPSNDCLLKFGYILFTALLATMFFFVINSLHILIVGILCVLRRPRRGSWRSLSEPGKNGRRKSLVSLESCLG